MPRGKRLVTPFREIVRLPVVSRRATSTRKSSKFSPLLETETRDLLKARPVRSHDGRFPFFEHLSLADQRVVRISVSDDRRILACGRRRGSSTRNAAYRPGLPTGSGPPSYVAIDFSVKPKTSSAVSTVRQSGLANTGPIGTSSARIASPMAREFWRPLSLRTRWVVQSSNFTGG